MKQSRQIRRELTRLDVSSTTLAVFGPREEEEEERKLLAEEDMCLELSKLLRLNEELCAAETKAHILGANVEQMLKHQRPPRDPPYQSLETARLLSELTSLQRSNGRAISVIEANEKSLGELAQATKEAKIVVKRLEFDVNVVEKENRRLNNSFAKLNELKIPDCEGESETIYAELKALQMQSEDVKASEEYVELRTLTEKSEEEEAGKSTPPISEMVQCSRFNLSPSSSGASSGAEEQNQLRNPAGAQLEDNSDTGLSSLHESGDDEANNTLLNLDKLSARERIGLDFGTLV